MQLLSAPGLLWRNEGLACQISQRLLAKMFPVVVTPGEAYLTPGNILSTAAACDRLMVAGDSASLDGALEVLRAPGYYRDGARYTVLEATPAPEA